MGVENTQQLIALGLRHCEACSVSRPSLQLIEIGTTMKPRNQRFPITFSQWFARVGALNFDISSRLGRLPLVAKPKLAKHLPMLEVSQFSLALERFTGELPSISVAKPVD